jgi:hypothetical protein
MIIFAILFFSLKTFAQEPKVVGIFYYKNILGQVHESPVMNSPQVTTIQCNHPVKVLESDKVKVDPSWKYVEISDMKGFILADSLLPEKKVCFQGKYPKFWESLNLDLVQLYYWGKLFDQFVQGETKVP